MLHVSHRVGSHINMCFLCHTGSFSHQYVLPMSHIGSDLASTCASYPMSHTLGQISHRHVLPMSHRVGSHICNNTPACASCVTQGRPHINMCFLCHIGSDLTSTCASRVTQGRAYLTSTCASCVTQGRSHINMYVLPMSHRAGITTSCIIQGLSYVT